MKALPPLVHQIAFWGLCLIALAWMAATFLFETQMGWPVSGFQWTKRLFGWGVELMLIRALVLGVRRCQRAAMGR